MTLLVGEAVDPGKRPTGVLGEELSGKAAQRVHHVGTPVTKLADVPPALKMQKGDSFWEPPSVFAAICRA
jgi:hypothetical protein